MNEMNDPHTAWPYKDDARWPSPTNEMIKERDFNKIWNVIKSWDINVPAIYSGYCGATGNHVRAILDALRAND